MQKAPNNTANTLTFSHSFIAIGIIGGVQSFGSFTGFLGGALVGFICHLVHHLFYEKALYDGRELTEFYAKVIMLSAKCAKADGAVSAQEVQAFKKLVDIPEKYVSHVSKLFDDARKNISGYENIAQDIFIMCREHRQKDIDALYAGLHFIAAANGHINSQQMAFLKAVGTIFSISDENQKILRLGWGIDEEGYVKESAQSRTSSGFGATPTSKELKKAYLLLELTEEASYTDIKKAYRKKIKQHHPDKLRGNGASPMESKKAEAQISEFTEAYESLLARHTT